MANITVRVMSNPLHSLLEARLAADIRQQLAIAEAAHGWCALRNSALEQGSHLADESSLDLIAHPVIDGAIECIPRHRQAELEGIEWRRAFALLRRHGDAGCLVDLQGADDATKVTAASPGRRWVHLM